MNMVTEKKVTVTEENLILNFMKNRFIKSESTTEILNSRVTMNELEALDENHKQAFLESLRAQSPELFYEYTAWKKVVIK